MFYFHFEVLETTTQTGVNMADGLIWLSNVTVILLFIFSGTSNTVVTELEFFDFCDLLYIWQNRIYFFLGVEAGVGAEIETVATTAEIENTAVVETETTGKRQNVQKSIVQKNVGLRRCLGWILWPKNTLIELSKFEDTYEQKTHHTNIHFIVVN